MLQIRLVQVGFACPEAYEAYVGEEHVAYLRLRHGSFAVHCPDMDGDVVYLSSPRGDGIFEEDERPRELQRAVNAISRHLQKLQEEEKLAEYTVEQEDAKDASC
jgi:hypothetical protein